MSSATREDLIQRVRETWPQAGSGWYPERRGFTDIPPVRDAGVTIRLIEHTVDTVLEMIGQQIGEHHG